MIYQTASISKCGPRAINQDAVGIWRLGDVLAVAVADGLGGMGGGERASRIAITKFEEFFLSSGQASRNLRQVALDIHSVILDVQKSDPNLSTMATTFVAGIFCENQLRAVNVGDSRIAIARGTGVVRLTKDHSEAQRLFDSGKLSKAELSDYPRKNILESALGIHGDVEIDELQFELNVGDKFFFSTDGVHNRVLLRELRQMATGGGNPQSLVADVDALIQERGAEDNYSLVAVYVEDVASEQPGVGRTNSSEPLRLE